MSPAVKLTAAQRRHLEELVEHGPYWRPASSGEHRCAAALARKGMVEGPTFGYGVTTYELTEAGRAAVTPLPSEGAAAASAWTPEHDAFVTGQLARENGQPRDCPWPVSERNRATTWLEGWDRADAALKREIPPPTGELACDATGHAWMPAGGGMLICARCEETKWADERAGAARAVDDPGETR